MNFTFRNILAVSYLILMAILPVTEAGFGTGPGTDPYGFGDESDFPEFHFVMMSKEQLTRLTQNLHHSIQVDPIPLEDLKYACFSMTHTIAPNGTLHTVTGFGDLSLDLFVALTGFPGLFRSDPMFPTNVANLVSLSLSNGVSFTLGVVCHDDGVGAWIVNSPNWSISEEDIYAISQHVASLGFNMDNIVVMDNSKCGDQQDLKSYNKYTTQHRKPNRNGNQNCKSQAY
ncbi:hypothetical protein Fcan01_00935 [Folsomia candida]|uniref:Uncharacterized protein n=1 Tax=Folsomia candida TaxID=158441 RepID=A0A226F414_FOLCA|nr:hypothetical protein Fcan01_00935 [Folsomia candida]